MALSYAARCAQRLLGSDFKCIGLRSLNVTMGLFEERVSGVRRTRKHVVRTFYSVPSTPLFWPGWIDLCKKAGGENSKQDPVLTTFLTQSRP
jgi:hypothetical protein